MGYSLTQNYDEVKVEVDMQAENQLNDYTDTQPNPQTIEQIASQEQLVESGNSPQIDNLTGGKLDEAPKPNQ